MQPELLPESVHYHMDRKIFAEMDCKILAETVLRFIGQCDIIAANNLDS